MDQGFKQLLTAFLVKSTGHQKFSFEPLAGDGSHRLFWRVSATETGKSLIAMANPPITPDRGRENSAYVMIAHHLQQKGISLPVIYQYDLAMGWFIMEDLGSVNLQEAVLSCNDPIPLYSRVVKHLFRLQTLGHEGFDPSWCAQTKHYDRTVMLKYEAHYFRDAFLEGFLGYKQPFYGLETAFDHLAEKASRANGHFFMHRDFQSRNIMVDGEKIGIIDWQGGRLGPLAYDLASMLLDPYVLLSEFQRRKIFDAYVDLLKGYNPALAGPFKRDYPYLAVQRNLQILGAFSFLSKVMNKMQFAAYIPGALKTLEALIDDLGDPRLKPLGELVKNIDLSE